MQRILVVDDDHSIRESIRLALDTIGMTAVTAESGERALEAFDGAFDGAIVDLMMPGINGFETIRALRARAPDLPVIVVSGSLVQAGPGAEDLLRMALGWTASRSWQSRSSSRSCCEPRAPASSTRSRRCRRCSPPPDQPPRELWIAPDGVKPFW